LGSKNKAKAFYIRKQSSNVKASPAQEKELFRMSESIPFDDRINYKASMDDLDRQLIAEFLQNTDSRNALRFMDGRETEQLAADLRVCSNAPGIMKPLNVGLMFFSRRPADFFRYAYIDVIVYPNSVGNKVQSVRFDGPLDHQIRESVAYMRTIVITKITQKYRDRIESESAFNYPLEAVEEAIVNAVLHKDYSIPEPISVNIYQDRMEITSIPGPDHTIPYDDVINGTMRSRIYRNRRIGDMLEKLDLAEVKNTGMMTIADAMSRNGSPDAVFQTDDPRTYLSVILPIHGLFLSGAGGTVRGRRSSEQIAEEVLSILEEEGEVSMKDIAGRMGYASVPTSLKNAVAVLRAAGSIEFTEHNPNNPNQRLRLRNRNGPADR